MYIQHTLQCASRLHSLFYLLDLVVIYLKTYIAILNIKKSLGLILKNKRSCSFSTRAEINSSRALPVIARVWLRHCVGFTDVYSESETHGHSHRLVVES